VRRAAGVLGAGLFVFALSCAAPTPTPTAEQPALARLAPHIALAQAGSPANAAAIVAEVNGQPITRRDLEEELALDGEWLRLQRTGAKGGEALKKKLRERDLDLLIDDMLISQSAKKKKIVLTPEEEKEIDRRFEDRVKEDFGSMEAFAEYLQERGVSLDRQKSRFKNHFYLIKLMEADAFKTDTFVRPADIRDYYTAHREEYREPGQVVFAHIDFMRAGHSADEVRTTAEQALADLKAGKPFEELARERSEGPHREEGGVMKVDGLGSLQKELAEALRRLQPGEVSGVIETPRYLSIVRLDSAKQESYKAFEDVEPEIEQKLDEQRRMDRLSDLKTRLRQEATIKVYAEVLAAIK
jgi:parvulin-like peptidyl-prolyl isomerase